jgi:hypothetical protein
MRASKRDRVVEWIALSDLPLHGFLKTIHAGFDDAIYLGWAAVMKGSQQAKFLQHLCQRSASGLVRHAELARFEAAQAALEAAPSAAPLSAESQGPSRGAPAKYKWDDFYCALAVMTHAEGIPETQTELTRRMMDWFGKQNLYPDPTTVKRKVATFWRQYHEAIARNPA